MSSGSSWFLTEPHVALESLESSRHLELFESTGVLLVVSSWESLRLMAVGVIFSSESEVDVSTPSATQQRGAVAGYAVSSGRGDLGRAPLVGQSCVMLSPYCTLWL